MRVLIEVQRVGDDGWDVKVTGPDLDRRGTMHRIEDDRGGWFPAPAAGACPEGHSDHEDCLRGAEAVRHAHDEVAVRREPSEAEVVTQLGRYLFECLLGQDTWKEIKRAAADAGEGARVVELALAWDREQRDLNRRMNWELLHDGRRFLVEGYGRADVTVTRVVPGAEATLEELHGPPRVLFAIGAAATDPVIRPGAEIIGLLRHVESRGRTLHHRLLENASPQALADAVREFRPDVVHLICHGDVEGDESVLLLRPDEPDQTAAGPCNATQLLQHLRVDGVLPRLVVLSACKSGGTPRLLGGYDTAPLATQLVHGGVPVVVGMAGEISDLASRLFARSFGKALVGGTSLAEASAEARRAGLAGGALTSRSVDWAFPTVFMSEHVDPARSLVAPGADEAAKLVNNWISSYGLDEKPVFCGRTEFLDAYWRMLHGGRAQVLAVSVRGEGVRLGRTRLLRELAKQALRDGHVPLLLGTDRTEDPPRDLSGLRKSVERAVTDVREWLDLPQSASGQLSLLRTYERTGAADGRLDLHVASRLDLEGEVTPDVVRRALQLDFARLAADARARHPHIARDDARGPGRVIVLIDGIDDSAVALVEALHDRLLGSHGLGTTDEPVPVVLAFSHFGRDNILRQIAEHQSAKPWLDVRELRPFQPDGEDLMAYEQVMLHPFNPGVYQGISDLAWVFNRELRKPTGQPEGPSLWDEYVTHARDSFQGRPSVFTERLFYIVLKSLSFGDKPFVMPANDEATLEALREAGRQP